MQVSERKVPDCSRACCGGVVPGKFVRAKADPAAMHYRAAKGAGCQYVNYRRHEARAWWRQAAHEALCTRSGLHDCLNS